MKEKNPGYSFLTDQTPEQKKALVKQNFDNLAANTCGCPSCSKEFDRQLENHILTAPVGEIKFMSKEVLKEEVLLIQFRRRKEREFKGPIVKKPKRYFS